MFSATTTARQQYCCAKAEINVDNLDLKIPTKPALIPATRKSDGCGVLLSVPCDENGDYDYTQATEVPMSEYDINTPSDSGSKTFEGQVQDLILPVADTAQATPADALAAATLPDLLCKETGQTVAATLDDVCGYKVYRLPCETPYLTDPTDASSAATVGADDAAYIGGVPINMTDDSAFAGVDLTRPIATGAEAVLVWCFEFSRKLTKAEIAAL